MTNNATARRSWSLRFGFIAILTAATVLVASPRGAWAEDGRWTAFAGADLPLAPHDGYADVFDAGPTLGAQYRYPWKSVLSLVGEGAYGTMNNPHPIVINPLASPVRDAHGADLNRFRLSGGIAIESSRDHGVNVYGKVLGGLYAHSVGDVEFTTRFPDAEPGPYTWQSDTFFDFGVNTGGAIELPVRGSTRVFAGADLDFIFTHPDFPGAGGGTGDVLTDVTLKAGISFRM